MVQLQYSIQACEALGFIEKIRLTQAFLRNSMNGTVLNQSHVCFTLEDK